MDYVSLGRSGLTCSVLGLGGGSSSRFGLVKGGTRSDALNLIHAALDEGITFFDGAGITGGIDELLADGLGDRRKDVILSTKVHLGPEPISIGKMRLANKASSWTARRMGMVCSAAALRRRVERTLKALRTDQVDVLSLHAVTPAQYRRGILRILPELHRLKDEGKIRVVGITEGFLSDPGHEMLEVASADGHFDVMMVGFNALNSSAAAKVLPAAKSAGSGTIGMFVLRGLLSGSARMTGILEEAGAQSLPELAFRFARHQDGMDVVLTGTGSIEHLRQNIAAAHLPPLPPAVLARLNPGAHPPENARR